MNDRTVSISVSRMQLVLAALGIAGSIVAANATITTWVSTSVVNDKLKEHAATPHARAVTKDELADIQSRQAEIRSVQAGFTSDITWIKNTLVRIEGKLQ